MRPWFVAGRLKSDIRVDGNHETVNIWRLNRPFKLGGPMKPLRAALAILLLTGSLAAQEPKKSLPAPEKHTKAPATSPSTPEAQPASASTPAGKLSCGQCIPSNKPIVQGLDRWSVKTSLPSGSDPAHAKTVAIADFIALVDPPAANEARSEEHTSELQSRPHLVCRLLLEINKRSSRTSRDHPLGCR